MTFAFKKALKYRAKGRVALIGPAGSGKSFSALKLARTLVGPTGRIAAVDTEHGSLSKYAHTPTCPPDCDNQNHFDFDVLELDSYSPENFLGALDAAEKAGYDAFLTDSLSHFWMGKDGALEFVDVASKRSSSKDGMSGWKEFRPHERQMVDAMIASPMHIVCTMRTKTAYEEQVNERTGKKQRVKIGLAPVQREGLEYEFDLVGLMDEDNTFIVDKSRCPELSGKALTKPGEKEFASFRDWLSGSPAPIAPATHTVPLAPQPHLVSKPSPIPQQPQNATSANFHVTGNRVTCFALNVEQRHTKATDTKPIRPFWVLKMNGKVANKDLVFCWHASLFDALQTAKNKTVQFEIEESGNFLNMVDLLDIDGQEYRDGKPYSEPEPVQQPLEITDDDIPF